MEITVPEKLDGYTHGAVVKALLELNSHLKVPERTAWAVSVPDLVHKQERIAVEVELSDLTFAWGQCLAYYRQGAKEIHLLLTPKLYAKYANNEERFIVENPIPNIRVYCLPEVKRPPRKPPKPRLEKKTVKVEVHHPEEKFYPPKKFSREEPRFIKTKDGSVIQLSFGEVEKRVGVEHVFFRVGSTRETLKCPVCRGKLVGEKYRNVGGEKVVLFVCPGCGHSEVR